MSAANCAGCFTTPRRYAFGGIRLSAYSALRELTGHGLKDPDTAIKQSSGPLHKIKAELGAVKKAILDNLPG